MTGFQGTDKGTARQEFEGVLEPMGPGGAWNCLMIPFNVAEAFGSKARVAVTGSINGFALRRSIFPTGDGHHFMMVNKAMQKGATVDLGDTVRVVLEKDSAPRTLEVPTDLEEALSRDEAARLSFDRMPYSHRKEYVDWIESAKREETRASRIERALPMLTEGKRLKG